MIISKQLKYSYNLLTEYHSISNFLFTFNCMYLNHCIWIDLEEMIDVNI